MYVHHGKPSPERMSELLIPDRATVGIASTLNCASSVEACKGKKKGFNVKLLAKRQIIRGRRLQNDHLFASLRTHEMYSYHSKPRKCRVFGAPYSIGTSRILVVLNEKDIDYDLRIFDTTNRGLRILTKEHLEPQYLALQPFGKTPLFQDHEVTMFESRAIIRHIASKHDEHGPQLYGTNEKERAMVDQWLEVESQNFNPAIAPAVYHLVFAAWFGKMGDTSIVNSSIERLEKVFDIYEAQLMKTHYLAGDFVSIADLSHLPFTYYLIEHAGRDDLFCTRPYVSNWWLNIAQRPSWINHLSRAYPKIYNNPHT